MRLGTGVHIIRAYMHLLPWHVTNERETMPV